jgi:hypothetical protein
VRACARRAWRAPIMRGLSVTWMCWVNPLQREGKDRARSLGRNLRRPVVRHAAIAGGARAAIGGGAGGYRRWRGAKLNHRVPRTCPRSPRKKAARLYAGSIWEAKIRTLVLGFAAGAEMAAQRLPNPHRTSSGSCMNRSSHSSVPPRSDAPLRRSNCIPPCRRCRRSDCHRAAKAGHGSGGR